MDHSIYKNERINGTWNLGDLPVKLAKADKTRNEPIEKRSLSPLIRKGKRKEKKPTTLKKKILAARELVEPDSQPTFSLESDELDTQVFALLKTMKTRQDALWKKNENKARAHRNIVCGIHETLKHAIAGNVVCVFISKNIDEELISGSASDLFHRLRQHCLTNSLPMIDACTKKSLSKAVSRFPYTNVVGLMRYQGLEDQLQSIVTAWTASRSHISYHIDQQSIFP